MHRRAFTLIELLVVISIISLLASVVLSSLNSARARARDARRVSDIREIQTALGSYYAEHGQYPNSNHTYSYSSQYPQHVSGWNSVMNTIGFSQPPVDPINNDTYRYYYISYNPWCDNQAYIVRLVLESSMKQQWEANDGVWRDATHFDDSSQDITLGVDCPEALAD